MARDLALLALLLRLATRTPAALPGNRGGGAGPDVTEPPSPAPRPAALGRALLPRLGSQSARREALGETELLQGLRVRGAPDGLVV